MFEKIFETKVEDIIFEKIEHFDGIKEYNFSVLQVCIIYNKDVRQEISLRLIKHGKIKESIFCYWSLLYEEYIKENEECLNQIPKNTVISQEIEGNGVILRFDPFINYYAEVNLIELEELDLKDKELERWIEYFKAENKDILFIGKKKVLKKV